jgi:microcystin-dependent protein
MDPFLGEIRLFSIGFTPRGWLACEGQLLPVQQNAALYSLLGVQYGGNGSTTFALPDLRGRVPVGSGSTYVAGQAAGEENHTLLVTEMPGHNHEVKASSAAVDVTSPKNATWGSFAEGYAASANTVLSPAAIGLAGSSAPHNNMQPYLALNFCIATSGIYPSRP